MSVDEFIMDLNELDFPESELGDHSQQWGWRKEKGRFACLVPNCSKNGLTFAHKFALMRHWDEFHTLEITLFRCNVDGNCKYFRRSYDLERHLMRIHHLVPAAAKAYIQLGNVKTKSVPNHNFIDPGELVGPLKKSRSASGTAKPSMVLVPEETVKQDVPPEYVKVNFDPRELDGEVKVELGHANTVDIFLGGNVQM